MATAGVVLMILGVVIVFVSLVISLVNVAKNARNLFDNDLDKDDSIFGQVFRRHIGAVIGMVTGGLVTALGLGLLVIPIILRIAANQ